MIKWLHSSKLDYPIRIRQLAITGTKGYAELNFMTQEVTFFQSKYQEIPGTGGEASIKFDETEKIKVEFEKKEPLKEELNHFLYCIQTNIQPLVHGNVGKQALDISLSSMKSMNMTYSLS